MEEKSFITVCNKLQQYIQINRDDILEEFEKSTYYDWIMSSDLAVFFMSELSKWLNESIVYNGIDRSESLRQKLKQTFNDYNPNNY